MSIKSLSAETKVVLFEIPYALHRTSYGVTTTYNIWVIIPDISRSEFDAFLQALVQRLDPKTYQVADSTASDCYRVSIYKKHIACPICHGSMVYHQPVHSIGIEEYGHEGIVLHRYVNNLHFEIRSCQHPWDGWDGIRPIAAGHEPASDPLGSEAKTDMRPAACVGCKNYHGKTYGGNRLICAIHPIAYERDNCPDRRLS